MPNVLPEPSPGAELAPRQGRERGSDTALRLAVEQGGDTAATAVQLAMLETLERLSQGGEQKSRGHRGETMEELLFGTDDQGAGSSDGSTRLGGGVR
eukprot:4861533-Amphidinium_carterae.1